MVQILIGVHLNLIEIVPVHAFKVVVEIAIKDW